MSRQDTRTPSRTRLIANRISRMRRPTRILLSAAISLILVILASLIIDRLFIQGVYEGDVDPMTPALVVVGLGLVFYGVGWWAMVGFDLDPDHPWQAGIPAVAYVSVGLIGFVLMIILILLGLVIGYYL